MFVKKYFTVRHKILELLAKHQDSFPLRTPVAERMLPFSVIAERFKRYDKDLLLDNLQYLVDLEEIRSTLEFDNSKFLILKDGRTSYRENKYKNLGIKYFRDNLFDTLKIISTAVLLLIAIYTFLYNIYQTGQNKNDIKAIREELKTIQNASILKPH